MGQQYNDQNIPGKNKAIASLVLGIIAVVLWFFGYSSILSIILGIIGLVMASKAKEEGYDDSLRMAGFVLSLIGLIGGALFFVAMRVWAWHARGCWEWPVWDRHCDRGSCIFVA